MSKEEKIIPKSVESLLTEFRELKDRLGGVQDYLASLHEAKDTEGIDEAEEADQKEETYITFKKAQDVLMITDQIVHQMQVMNYITDPLFQQELSKAGKRVIGIHHRLLNHLEK